MYELDLEQVADRQVRSLGGKFFGEGPRGSIGFTSQSMLVDGQPFFGISGEVHYSRVSPDQWEDTLIKARCGGVNLIATYVFWNVHEEVEGVFRFDGCRDIRRFVELCGKHGLMVILRIGPFDHGEMRNGGLPDWLYGKPFEVRDNNEGYLACARRLYRAIHGQVDGLYFSQGGPIVGIQLENEYMHSSAPWEITTGVANEWVNGGHDGEDHIRALKQIAREEGLIAPFYTCTAWGGGMAPVDEVLPLWGGYAYWPWIFYSKTGEHPCTPEYIYRDNHNNAVPRTYNFEPRYAPESMPYACCEMMGGMMCSYNYRFTLPMESVDALANIKLGSGCSMLGYYMYRGGTTPTGEKTPFLNEGQVCKRSYDYQAPIGEYGQRRDSYYRLRTLHDFCVSFQEQLLDTVTVLPEECDGMQPEDRDTLRFCVRVKGNSGFLFVNNFQDHLSLPARDDERITLRLPGGSVSFAISLASGENCVLPFNLAMGSVLLKAATVQPITHLTLDGQSCWFFMIPEGMKPVMQFADRTMTLPDNGISDFTIGQERVIVLPRQDALRFSHLEKDGQSIAVLSDSGILWDGQRAHLETAGQPQAVLTMPCLLGDEIRRGPFAGRMFASAAAPAVPLDATQVGPSRWTVRIPAEALSGHKAVLLRVAYMGNIGQAFIDGDMISDNFCNGQPWDIRLDDHASRLAQHPLTLYVVPIKEGASVSVDSTMAARMEHVKDIVATIGSLTLHWVDDVELPL
ncbi:MAG: beta-galactosidase [Aristaeellaceae bacterium]